MIKPDPFLDLIPRLDGEEARAPSRADLDNPATVLAVRDDAGRAHLTRVGLADPFILSSARAIGVVDFMLIDDAQLEVLARQGEPC